MPDETPSRSSSLTGVWNGSYGYITFASMPDNAFVAVIIDSGGFLSGTIYEAFRFPSGELVDATATMQGHHRSHQVDFVKTYDGAPGGSIFYEGALSSDANEIQGQWRLDTGNRTEIGRFIMTRNLSRTTTATTSAELEPA